jgi:hypothetical protein
MYKVCADVQNIAVKQVPLTPDFQVDTKKVLETADTHTKIIWICSPNNPSGNIIERASILHILDNFTTGFVVVDEAYIDFASEESFTKILDKYPNLIVMQTFSKAWGLAALRLGMAFTSEEFIKILNKIKYPYNLNGITQKLLYTALGKVEKKDKFVKQILKERGRLQKKLSDLSIVKHIFPTDSNQLLVKFTDANTVFQLLIEKKIITRLRSNVILCEDCHRLVHIMIEVSHRELDIRTAVDFVKEQIELQAHGTYVAYRNIYIRPIEANTNTPLSDEEKKQGFESLFDGTHLDKWIGNKIGYALEDGVIVTHPELGGGNLYTADEFSDFEYRFEFQLTPGANNGLGIRTPTEGDAAYEGMELQILDNESPIYEKLKPYQYHGSVYGVIPAKRGYLKPTGEWNSQTVIAKGNKMKVILNGQVILDGDIQEASKNGTMDGNKHPGLMNAKGYIGFLGHGDVVRFRNIRIKKL